MRLTDDRYAGQRHRLEIALRMIRHEARTATIRACTGISEDRIRKLHRSYFGEGHAAPHRKRGRSPQQSYCLTHNVNARMDAGLLAGLFVSTGVLQDLRLTGSPEVDLKLGARICDVYDVFLQLRPKPQCKLSFEHAWFLLRTLAIGTEFTLAPCPRCAGAMLFDRYSARRSLCPLCEIKHLAEPISSPRRRRRPRRF